MTEPRAQNGILFIGPWQEEAPRLVEERWPFARTTPLDEGGLFRIDLSDSRRGSCPGFNDGDGLAALSGLHREAVAIGFFCDGIGGAEGVRLFEGGRARERSKVTWAAPPHGDPLGWPIGRLALTLRLPIEAITQVERPPRPRLAVAIEALLSGETPDDGELHAEALQALGEIDLAEATTALVRELGAEDWVLRFHAVRSYARLLRGQGAEERPRLESLLADSDEGVRESALRGIAELVPQVEFSDADLQEQIDRAVARGLEDEDEDVQAAAGEAQRLRRELLG